MCKKVVHKVFIFSPKSIKHFAYMDKFNFELPQINLASRPSPLDSHLHGYITLPLDA